MSGSIIYQRSSRHQKSGGGGGQTIRYCHLSCKLKYAEALLMTRSGGAMPPFSKCGGQLPPLFLPL